MFDFISINSRHPVQAPAVGLLYLVGQSSFAALRVVDHGLEVLTAGQICGGHPPARPAIVRRQRVVTALSLPKNAEIILL